MTRTISRRNFLAGSSSLAAGFYFAPRLRAASAQRGVVIGDPFAEQAGARIFQQGGTAVDAIIAGALAAAVTALNQTGIGGFGCTGMFALDGGKKIIALDGNSTAPAAMRPDTFKLDDKGKVPGRVNEIGWLAAGVPGLMAGLQLVIDRLATLKFAQLAQSAIQLTRDGYKVYDSLASTFTASAAQFKLDEGSRKLYLPEGRPVKTGEIFRNPDLARLLQTLADRDSADSFYRGDIGKLIAEGFAKNGGLVTAEDMAAHQARFVQPMTMNWGPYTLHTLPLTAGGSTLLQPLKALQALDLAAIPAGPRRAFAQAEALRITWSERLSLLGDPDFVNSPIDRLLSEDHAKDSAGRIAAAMKAGKPIDHKIHTETQGGTISLSAIDDRGNMAALTITHGNAYGAKVTVDGLGLTLGHGMSRFDPTPGHPNSPGPRKRPLQNMCGTVVARDGKPIWAVGGRGGRKIPNAVFQSILQLLINGRNLADSIAAPRMHTEGMLNLQLEKHWPDDQARSLKSYGYKVSTAASAVLSAVAYENGQMASAMR